MRVWLMVACWSLCCCISPLPAQVRKAKANATGQDLCVDVAALRAGKSIRGLIISGEGTGNSPWILAVEREATRKDQPALYKRAAKTEAEKALRALNELKTRTEQELALTNEDGPYKAFLQRELDRLSGLRNAWQNRDELPTRFLWVELTNKECTGVRRASADAQRVAVWAWSENLADVTKRDRADLEQELTRLNIDVKLKVPDLSEELPPRPEPDRAWFARLAILRYTLIGGIDFQGSSGVFMRAGDRQGLNAAELGPLIQKMMGGSLDELIKELDPASKAAARQTNDAQWFSSVTSQVDTLNRREFRITRLHQDPLGQAARVETALVAKLPEQGWQIVWSSQQTHAAAEVTAQAEQKVSQDPQIQTALGLLSALGAGAEAEVKKALRYGAATMAAQEAAENDFLRFSDRFTRRLDGPPLNP